jgi:hypothetical protein
LQSDVERWLEKRGRLGSSVAHENVELSELVLQLAKDVSNLCRIRHIGLHRQAIGSALADLSERVFRGGFILVVVNCDFDAILRQCPMRFLARCPGNSQ